MAYGLQSLTVHNIKKDVLAVFLLSLAGLSNRYVRTGDHHSGESAMQFFEAFRIPSRLPVYQFTDRQGQGCRALENDSGKPDLPGKSRRRMNGKNNIRASIVEIGQERINGDLAFPSTRRPLFSGTTGTSSIPFPPFRQEMPRIMAPTHSVNTG